jgi:hypothetical protein
MQLLRGTDLLTSDLPGLIGCCPSDRAKVYPLVNRAQEKLLYAKEAAEEGWWGTFAEVQFQASRTTPYVTMSREIARLEMLNVCNRPVPLRNQFYEYLQYGNGRMPKMGPWCHWPRYTQGFTRNSVPTFVDPVNPPNPFFLKAFVTNSNDANGVNRILFQGLDSTGSTIYTQDGGNEVVGQFTPFAFPFVIAQQEMTAITGIQKDVTQGAVQIFQSDPAGIIPDTLLLTMQPGETTASYRRYYLDHLPCWCCQPQPPVTSPQPVTVNAIVKLDLVPIVYDTDYALIQSKEAIILTCQALRMERMDSNTTIAKAKAYFDEAIRLLQGQVTHFLGKNTIAVNFSPFGTADLRRVRIGMK